MPQPKSTSFVEMSQVKTPEPQTGRVTLQRAYSIASQILEGGFGNAARVEKVSSDLRRIDDPELVKVADAFDAFAEAVRGIRRESTVLDNAIRQMLHG